MWRVPFVASATEDGISVDHGNQVQLCGTLKREMHWGPPGFGETPKSDIKWVAWLLVLRKPTVFYHKGDNGENIAEELTRVQIGLGSHEFDDQLRRAVDSQIVVGGKIWSASSQGDVTPVVIWISSMAVTN